MKLCIVTPNVIKGDGQGRANYEIVWEAVRRGHHVTLLASKVDPELANHSLVDWISLQVNQYPTYLLREIVFASRSTAWLQKHRRQFDLVQAYGAITWAAADVNTVQFVHSGWIKSPVHISRIRRDYYAAYQWFYTLFNAALEKRAFRQAKVVIAVSEKIKKELLDIGVPDKSIHVILNGVDLQEFFPGEPSRSKLGLPEGVPLAVFVGDIRSNRKNLDTVLYALTKVQDLHLAVVGSLEGSPYPELAQKLQLGGRVHFLGFRRDVAQIMQAVDLFVFPSRYEACTLVLLEAMATGLPVITASTAGGAEIVTPDCGVVLSDSEDTNALAEALSKLISNHDQRKRMGEAARHVAQQHSWASKAASYVNLFESITNK
ncbi:glycosyltransferase family 4 protein [Aetokthonos hydrillicola Thurmond2011]|jgi:glycosyltransferase involved in cell wall biosynthesis|uniref:Glycosyltransferase family 4 protein n=1 Tax=Aetokthonos hydrillicola Thurmond2011 TaxID=2712845 RepID=A0AAP5ICI2_9CYAN|nr:glycosyltransferase family 4 protein [Aetokthonos hydrillicola]MBO3461302.1 glycosyltransferase family 4 protein [Aetokthonos hydrillicola CCALA 1050]MBW4589640.1 glycosyltransferase family 4 protein [Aetokthonos hydrillicola CCALA 1050]MDR9899137.1 glycosyltransferase family 4 protein [Aetokthonos hydrillicola Thurmond2011]